MPASAAPISPGRLADEVDRAAALADGRDERREVRALPPAAEDDVDPAREGPDADDGGGDVRGLGVVDVEHAADRRDLLEPVRDPGERRQRRPHRLGLHAAREA